MAESVHAELRSIASLGDQKEKTAAYKALLDNSLAEPEALKAIVTHLLDEDVLLVVSRAAITHLATAVQRLDPETHKWKLELISFCLAKLKPRLLSFEEADVVLREALADLYVDEEEYIEAAKALAAINLESSARQYSDVQKAEKYVKIAELYLQEDETVDAENFINRASRFIHNVEDWTLKLRYQVSYARILDSKRKFLDAALRYYEFSQSKPDEVDPDDLLELLGKAVTCAILASAGPQRSRLLGTLYKDERVKASEHAPILEKMYTEQLIRRPELAGFEQSLLPHQKAVLANGFSVLENAFLEHNLLAASRVYSSISLDELGKLLAIEPASAERVAATMICEERMKGSIDQFSGFLEFENTDDEALAAFDAQIASICFNVNHCAEKIEQLYPQVATAHAGAAATAHAVLRKGHVAWREERHVERPVGRLGGLGVEKRRAEEQLPLVRFLPELGLALVRQVEVHDEVARVQRHVPRGLFLVAVVHVGRHDRGRVRVLLKGLREETAKVRLEKLHARGVGRDEKARREAVPFLAHAEVHGLGGAQHARRGVGQHVLVDVVVHAEGRREVDDVAGHASDRERRVRAQRAVHEQRDQNRGDAAVDGLDDALDARDRGRERDGRGEAEQRVHGREEALFLVGLREHDREPDEQRREERQAAARGRRAARRRQKQQRHGRGRGQQRRDVKVEREVEQVVAERLGAVERRVGLGAEHVVLDNVPRGQHELAVEVVVDADFSAQHGHADGGAREQARDEPARAQRVEHEGHAEHANVGPAAEHGDDAPEDSKEVAAVHPRAQQQHEQRHDEAAGQQRRAGVEEPGVEEQQHEQVPRRAAPKVGHARPVEERLAVRAREPERAAHAVEHEHLGRALRGRDAEEHGELRGLGHRPVDREVQVRAQRVRRAVLPRLEAEAVEQKMERLPVVEGLVAVGDRAQQRRRHARQHEQRHGRLERRRPQRALAYVHHDVLATGLRVGRLGGTAAASAARGGARGRVLAAWRHLLGRGG